MNVRKAQLKELPEILDNYNKLIDETAGSTNDAHWTKGFYPDEDLLKDQILSGDLYVLEDGKILAAAVLNKDCIEDYRKVPWKGKEPAHFIHLFASFERDKGHGKTFFEGIKNIAKSLGAKSLRLDTIDGNKGAMAFYTACGFDHLGRFKLDYDATEIEDFEVFENVL